MTDPGRMSEDERARAALPSQAEAVNHLDPVWSPEYGEDAYLAAQPVEPEVPRERLFSRKVLLGWSIATLIVVFFIRMVLPVILETVKQTVITSVKTSVGITDAPPLPAVPPVRPVTPVPAVPVVPELPSGQATPSATQGPVIGRTIEKPAPTQTPAKKTPAKK
ncbi:MAG: hypothetical protein ACXV5L_13180 [Thermoanaerobaculia bacterium]